MVTRDQLGRHISIVIIINYYVSSFLVMGATGRQAYASCQWDAVCSLMPVQQVLTCHYLGQTLDSLRVRYSYEWKYDFDPVSR